MRKVVIIDLRKKSEPQVPKAPTRRPWIARYAPYLSTLVFSSALIGYATWHLSSHKQTVTEERSGRDGFIDHRPDPPLHGKAAVDVTSDRTPKPMLDKAAAVEEFDDPPDKIAQTK